MPINIKNYANNSQEKGLGCTKKAIECHTVNGIDWRINDEMGRFERKMHFGRNTLTFTKHHKLILVSHIPRLHTDGTSTQHTQKTTVLYDIEPYTHRLIIRP